MPKGLTAAQNLPRGAERSGAQREHPTLAPCARRDHAGLREARLVTLRISAQGLSLASDEHMLLRVAAFGTDTTLERALETCASTGRADVEEQQG